MKVFFIRHGKDDGNYRGGWSAMPLLDEGKKQVKKLAQYLDENSKEFNIEKIISSDLERTKETTEIINEKIGAEVEYTDRLREINNGKIAGMLNEEVEKKFPGLYYNTLRMDERYPDMTVMYNALSETGANRNTAVSIKSSNSQNYWLSSRCVDAIWNSAHFALRFVSGGGSLGTNYLFNSDTLVHFTLCGLRPVLVVEK